MPRVVPDGGGRAPQLHPLIGRNASGFESVRFETVFTGEEFFLADHVVGGRRLLPGAAYLEMARAAGAEAMKRPVTALTHVAWLRPLVQDVSPVAVSVTLERSGEGARFRIESAAGTHAEGNLTGESAPAPERIDLDAIRADCPTERTGEELYRFFAASGLAYGRGFKAVAKGWAGEGEALAELVLPAGLDGGPEGFVLHPSLLDAATQAVALLEPEEAGREARVPFAVERVDIVGPLPARLFAHARRAGVSGDISKFDIDLIDEHGAVHAAIRGYSARSLVRIEVGTDDRPVLLVPRAIERMLVKGVAQGPVLAIAGPAWHDALRAEFGDRITFGNVEALATQGAEAADASILFLADSDIAVGEQGFTLAQTLAAGNGRRRVVLGHPLGGDPDAARAAALPALFGTLAQERPSLAIRCVGFADWRDREAVARRLARELASPEDAFGEVSWRGERRESQGWEEADWPVLAAPVYRDGGVYLITGASGGIGRIVTRALAERHGARLVLLSRNPVEDAFVADIERAGGEALAIAADVSDEAGLAAALDQARRRFGAIHGVFHAAGVLRDGLLQGLDKQAFATVSGPKVAGAINLDRALASEALDFFLLFSSSASLGNAGQGVYAYANRFLDRFAAWRDDRVRAGERQGHSVAVDWSPWLDGGMWAPDETLAWLRDRLGVVPLRTDEALDVLALAASGSLAQSRILPLAGDRARILASFVDEPSRSVAESPPAGAQAPGDRGRDALRYLTELLARELKLGPDQISPDDRFEQYGIDSVMAMQLTRALERDLGELPKTLFFEHRTVGELAERLGASHGEVLAVLRGPDSAEAAAAEPARSLPAVAARPIATTAPRLAEPIRRPGEEGIAIIGLSGRFPQAETLDEFWRNLCEGRDCIEEIPDERFDWRRHYDADPTRYGSLYAKWGGFLAVVDKFDPLFFRISPREAAFMDPQERLFMETAWACVESAGIAPSSLAGRRVGVYAGTMYGEYQLLGVEETARGNVLATASFYASVANRVSHALDLAGPSLAVDTMCSSSLTAIHLACQAIRDGECEMAIAGGVNVSIHMNKFLTLSQGRFAATDGRCRSFGADGDGYVPGEGVGAVLLKPLAQARADGDIVWGVVRGSALSHGGRTSGYTVPNPVAQGSVVEDAIRRAGVEAEDIGYIEAHGTGTSLGDPIEVNGLARAFGALTKIGADGAVPRAIGSVKSNIGHLEGAAGIAGVAKVLLQMRHGELVPTIHAETLNPNIDFGASSFAVQRDSAPWHRRVRDGVERPLLAGISSFGAGGANAHVVIEEHIAELAPRAAPDGPAIVVLSAKDGERLAAAAERLRDWIGDDDGADPWRLHDMAYTLQVGRDALPARLAFAARDMAGATAALERFLAGDRQEIYAGTVARGDAGSAQNAIAVDDPDAIARAWVSGAAIDWAARHDGVSARRIVLPTYPFARERCWIETTAPSETFESEPPDARRIILELDPADPLIESHKVAGVPVLPGMAAVALAFQAAERVWPGQTAVLTDLVWSRPLTVEAATRATLDLAEDGEVVLRDEAGETCARARIAAQAEEVLGAAPKPLIGGTLVDGYDLYTRLREGGLAYGAAHRGLRAVRVLGAEAEAELALPAGRDGLARAAWLDACLHGVAALAKAEEGVAVPFALREMRLRRDLPERATVRVARRPDGEYDIDVRDPAGVAVASMRGLVLRRLSGDTPTSEPRASEVADSGAEDPLADMIWRPRWRAEETPARADTPLEPVGAVAILAADPDSALAQALAAACPGAAIRPWGVAAEPAVTVYLLPPSDPVPLRDLDIAAPGAATADLLQVLRPLRESGARITVISGNAWALGAEDRVDPVAAGLSGLARGAAREANGLMAVVDIDPRDDAQTNAALIAAEPPQREGETIMLRRGVRYRMWLDPVELPRDRETPWRMGGHYLIVGGAGGIGQVLSQDLARRLGAKFTWIGRRMRDDSIDSGIAAIREAGGDAQYLSADATDPMALGSAVDQAIAGFGPVNGAIHSALVLRDGMLLRMDEGELLAAFDVKARGGMALARALEGWDLDFFAVFSSAVVFTANPGQANYAAGSAFLDALVGEIGRAGRWPVCAIDWGLWGGVGAVADDEVQRRMAAQGVEPIMPETGLVAIERALASGLPRVVPLKLAPALAAGLRHDPDVTTASLGAASRNADLAGLDISVAVPPAAKMARTREGFEALDIYARRGLAEMLADALPAPGETSEIESIRAALDVVPGQDRLFRALLDMLLREGVLRAAGERLTGLPRAPLPDLKNNAEIAPFQALLDACLAGLRDVLAGRAKGTDIVFPGGSQHLVEPVYRGDEVMDSYSRILADLVVGWLRRTGATAARLVEIGAGTGAATRFVLAALDEAGIEAEYLFTDLSPSFVERTRAAFDGESTALRFKTLDIARDPRDQGFVPGEADIVIASNVLHATAAIEKTIDHAKSLLAPGGLLAINEVTAVQDFATLTFGLLDGWWAFDSGEGRLDHAPLLSAPRWRDRLAAAGFRETRAYGLPGLDERAMPQAVIAAVADGWAQRRAITLAAAAPLAQAEVARHAPSGDAAADALDYARRVLAKALGMKPEMIDPDAPLTDYGLDSLVMMDVVRQLETDLGEAVPATLLVDAKTAGELGAWLAENRASALQVVLKPVGDVPAVEPIAAGGSLKDDLLPLSRQQLWHWSLGKLVPDAPGLVAVPASFRLEGHVDRERLQVAIDGVVARHATLRTVFVEGPDGPGQRVLDRMTVPVTPGLDEGPFDIERGPLLCVALREEGEGQRLDLLFHHIVADLWSVGVFMAELSDLYAGTAPPPLRLEFKDHIAAEAERLSGPEMVARRAFWTDRLQGADLTLDLGAGDGPSDLAAASRVARRHLPADFVGRLRAGGESLGCAPFAILFAVFAAMLHGRSAARRFPLGVPVANRGRAGSERLIGDFADIRLVVPEVDPQKSGRELVAAAGEALDMAARQELPFAETAGLIRTLRTDPSLLPLQACCTYTRQAGAAAPVLGGAPAVPVEGNRGALAFEMFLTMVESDGALDLNLEYLDRVMDGAGAEAWLARFESLLDSLLREPEAPLDRYLNAAGLVQSPVLRLVSSFTAEPVAEPLAFLGTAFRMPLRLDFAPYGQVMQELLDPASPARVQRQGAVALLWRLADLAGADAREGAEESSSLLAAAERFGEFAGAVENAARRLSVPLVVLRCPDRPNLEESAPWCALQARADRRLAAFGGAVAPMSDDWHDPAAEREGHVPYTDAGFGDIALALTRCLTARLLPARKLVVLDADNTLWDGVVGEVGPGGLTVDPARRAVQEMLVERQQAGLLLAVVSKNEIEDVEAGFAALPEMPLRPEHLVAVKASWRPKSEAIAELARDLGLGLESFAFIDDNPVECAEVRSRLPMVAVHPYPMAESESQGWIDRLWALNTGPAGTEDRRRTQMYRENAARAEAQAESGDFRAFLESLRLEVDIRPLVEGDIARAAQLTQRTNQFNTTTQRMTVEALRARDTRTSPVYTIRVRDRFGDYGLVGLACLGLETDVLAVEILLLSCRVLGRGVEQRIAGFLGESAVEKGMARLRFSYVPSARNRPAADFLESLPGVEREQRGGETTFALDARAAAETDLDIVMPDPAHPAAENGTETVADPGDGAARARAFEAVAGLWRDGAALYRAVRATAPRQKGMVGAQADFIAPAGGIETDIAALWREVLALPRVGAQDDFFRIGGTSLAAARMIGRLSDLVGRRLTLTDLMDRRTPATLAKLAAATRPVEVAITANPARRVYPLSPNQEALWPVARAGQGGAEYAVAAGGRTARRLDPDLAREAFRRVVARHPALRTTFPEETGRSIEGPVQVVQDEPRFDFSLHDFSTWPLAEREATARSHAQEFAQSPFDLAKGPLVRLGLYDLGGEGFGCLLAAQHLVIDGTSLALVMTEFRQAYADLSEGREPGFAPLPLSPGDVALWQRTRAEVADPDAKAFWRAALADPTPLPSSGGTEDAPGGLVTGRLDGDTLRRLDVFSAAQGATPFEVLFSLWHGVLAGITGATDICHGVPVDDRPRPEGDGLVGCFVKTLPVRLRCDLTQPFGALVDAVGETWRAARRHAGPPLWRILADAGLRAAPFASFFAYQQWPGEEDADFRPWTIDAGRSTMPVVLEILATEDGAAVRLEYGLGFADEPTARRLLDGFLAAAGEILVNPELPIARAASLVQPKSNVPSETLQLTPAQRRFFQLPMEDRAHWNSAVQLQVGLSFDLDRFVSAYLRIAEHRDALRVGFRRRGKAWVRESLDKAPGPVLRRGSLDGLGRKAGEELAKRLVAELQGEFDLASGGLIGFCHLTSRSKHRNRLILVGHRLILSDAAWPQFLSELDSVYRGGSPTTLPRNMPSAAVPGDTGIAEHVEQWEDLARRETLSGLPFDRPNVADLEGESDSVSILLDEEPTAALVSGAPDSTVPGEEDILVAALYTALTTWTGENGRWIVEWAGGSADTAADSALGWHGTHHPFLLSSGDPQAVRTARRSLPNGGSNFLALRHGPDRAIARRLEACRGEISYRHHGRIGDFESGSIFWGLFSFDIGALRDPRAVRPHALAIESTVVDNRLAIRIGFGRKRFSRNKLLRLAKAYQAALETLAAAGAAMPVTFSEEGTRRILAAGTGPIRARPEAPCVVDLIPWERYPDLATRAAGVFAAMAGHRGVPVAVCLPRGETLNATILGLLAAGAILVPMDPAWPDARIHTILEESGAIYVLTDSRGPGRFSNGRVEAIDAGALPTGDPAILRSRAAREDTAYLMFTSGSTGRPKGAALSHGALLNHSVATIEAFGIGPKDRVLQMAAPGFDVYLEELIPSLVAGAAVVPLADGGDLDPVAFLAFVAAEKLTVLNLPSAYWGLLAARMEKGLALPGSVRLTVVGGDRVAPAAVETWRRGTGGAPLSNAYGLTETAITTTAWTDDGRALDGAVPVGRPLANQQAHVLDDGLCPAEDDAVGMLHIGGAGLARGYWRDGELDSSLFPEIDLGAGALRLFATGDMARRRADGLIEILGRRDDQVQLRGHRIELAEVENTLASHPQVVQASVSAQGETLVAHVAGTVEPAALLAHARNILPAYMVPGAVHVLSALPVTSSGKIDREALATLPSKPQKPLRPRGKLEKALAELWREALDCLSVDAGRSFAEHGGHSIAALAISAQAREILGHALPATWLMESSSLRALAKRLSVAANPSWARLGGSGQGAALHILSGISGESGVLQPLADNLSDDRPVMGFDFEPTASSVMQMAEIGCSALSGNEALLLGGWSLGGVVAHAAARKLEQEGKAVAGLVLIDSVLGADLPGGAAEAALADWLMDMHGKPAQDEAEARSILRDLGMRTEPEAIEALVAPWRARRAAHAAYRPSGPVRCPVAFLQGCPGGGATDAAVANWRNLAGGHFRVFPLAADHFGLLDDPATAVALGDALAWIEEQDA
ncbi:MAG: SDR family NAD(P)-dependent oxidoreductase [Proteobacteria bacterium]|nr:SDR family NAD(P)-dependent oxidoreductase [Pseudomonadota bacterium]